MLQKFQKIFRSLTLLMKVIKSTRHNNSPIDQPISIGLITIMKNEAMNIREWLDHYKWQGVDRIFLIDNGSTDTTKNLIQTDIDSGFVEYFWRPESHKQNLHYQEVFETAEITKKVSWLMVADSDEFWYSTIGDIKSALTVLSPDADLIYTNWKIFGSSGFTEHPKSLRTELLYRNEWLDPHGNTKWICRTSRIIDSSAISIHKVRWIDSRRVVSDNEILRINHYVTQSLKYFTEVKMTRGSASGAVNDRVRNMSYFDRYNRDAVVLDRDLCDLVTGAQRPAVWKTTSMVR